MNDENEKPSEAAKSPEELSEEQLEELSGGRPRNFNPQPDPPA